ncbi:sulfotransferase [Roseovarius salis]|uniref:sulfotransferase n=1 Tax=Roseovarius salis TaxID=3376063 RepID=UPI0037C7B70E
MRSSKTNFVFVCGCARSGTSALTALLSSAEPIFIGMERYIGLYKRTKALTTDLFEPERFLTIKNGDSHIYSFEGRPHYKGIHKKIYNVNIIGDKIPRLYRDYDMLFNNFPACKVIFIYRNLFDVADSWDRRVESGVRWSANGDWRAAIKEWNHSLRSTVGHLGSGKILPVSYEDLFFGTGEIDRIKEFLKTDIPKPVGKNKETEKISDPFKNREICRLGQFGFYRKLEDFRFNN